MISNFFPAEKIELAQNDNEEVVELAGVNEILEEEIESNSNVMDYIDSEENEINDTQIILNDIDLRKLTEEEIGELQELIEKVEENAEEGMNAVQISAVFKLVYIRFSNTVKRKFTGILSHCKVMAPIFGLCGGTEAVYSSRENR